MVTGLLLVVTGLLLVVSQFVWVATLGHGSGRLVGHYLVAGWLRVVCSFLNRSCQELESSWSCVGHAWEDPVGQRAQTRTAEPPRGKTFYCTPPAKCPQTAIHYSQTLVGYLYLSQKDAAGFIMPTSRAFMLKSNLYSPVRPSCCSSPEVAILAVSATPMGPIAFAGTERLNTCIWVRVRI